MGFLMLLHALFAFAAMLMVFLICSCFCWYAHGFFDAFAHLVCFRCYAHGLFGVSCFCCYAHGSFDVVAQQLITTDNLNS